LGQGKKPEGDLKETRKGGSFRREFLQFLILFFILWLFSFLLTRRLPGITENLQIYVAREVAFCLDLLGYRFELDGALFTFFADHGGERLRVIPECTGLFTTIIYLSIIGAYPARIGEKLLGLLIGVPAIHLLNLFRMVFVSLVLYHKRELFDFFHGYLWQVSFVIFMLLLVIFWMGKIVKRPGAKISAEAARADEK
jgi:archaeosortase B (VPXXXP-CTERM-specific)